VDQAGPDPRPQAAVVVAHPDDETLWRGGYILTHPECHWRIVALSTEHDADRAPKFRRIQDAISDWVPKGVALRAEVIAESPRATGDRDRVVGARIDHPSQDSR
jgi:hypothetical protein